MLPITEDVVQMFQAIIPRTEMHRKREKPDGYKVDSCFTMIMECHSVAMHWQHHFNHMVGRHNDIYEYRCQILHLICCRHTYCLNMAKSGMNPKRHYSTSYVSIRIYQFTMNVCTRISDSMMRKIKWMEEFRKAQVEVEQKKETDVAEDVQVI